MKKYSERIVLHFPHRLVDQPIVYKLIKDYDLQFNILKAYVTPREKSKSLRVVSLMQVGEIKPIKTDADGKFICGDWKIRAELNPTVSAQLTVEGSGGCGFLLKDKDGASVLTEKTVQKAVDELPLAARQIQ